MTPSQRDWYSSRPAVPAFFIASCRFTTRSQSWGTTKAAISSIARSCKNLAGTLFYDCIFEQNLGSGIYLDHAQTTNIVAGNFFGNSVASIRLTDPNAVVIR